MARSRKTIIWEAKCMAIDGLVFRFRRSTIPFGTEQAVQDAIEDLLEHEKLNYTREFAIGRDRVDFLVDFRIDGNPFRIAIECKVAGGPSAVMEQLLRYAQSPDVDAIILVTSRNTHRFAVPTVNGKLFSVANVAGGRL